MCDAYERRVQRKRERTSKRLRRGQSHMEREGGRRRRRRRRAKETERT